MLKSKNDNIPKALNFFFITILDTLNLDYLK